MKMPSNNRKCVELIAFNKSHSPEYQGYCKLVVNIPSKTLNIKPKNEEFTIKTAPFKWKFFAKKNILFIFNERANKELALVFATEKLCKKIYDLIVEHKDNNDVVSQEMVNKRFLIPIFQKIDDKNYPRVKKIMIDWILCHSREEREIYLQLMKNVSQGNYEDMNVTTATRKRRCHERSNCIEAANYSENDAIKKMPDKKKKSVSNEYSTIIPSSQFKMVTVKIKGGFQRRFLIFTSEDKTKCYEYTFKNQRYLCRGCRKQRKHISAILEYDEEKREEYIKVMDNQHVCVPINYEPKKYNEVVIAKKPGYEYLQNCSTQSGRILFIFNPDDRNLCYEYLWRRLENKFYCRACHLKKKDTTTAEICNENEENEYVQLLNNDHVCEYVNFQPEKFKQFNNIVLKPDFEIQTKITSGQKTLIIFNKNDRSLCYSYFFSKDRNCFFCSDCYEKSSKVSARLCQNSEEEEYIILSNLEHVCKLRNYIPQTKEIIIRSPQIKFTIFDETKMLFIFTSLDNQNLCHIFTSAGKNCNRFICGKCYNLIESNEKNGKSKGNDKAMYCYLSKDDDEYYVKMPPGQTHICKAQKYEQQKYVTTTLQPKDYILFRQKFKTKELMYLAIYDPNNRRLCYKYCYDSKDSEGNEFIVKNQMKHICAPIKVSSVKKTKGVTILTKSGLTVCDKPEPRKRINVEESKILKLPNFELQRSVSGVKDGKLVIFKDGDRSLCYNYFFNKSEKLYACARCIHMKVRVRADLHIDKESSETCIILGKNEHVCEPVKYEPEKKEVENLNFMVFNRESKTKPIKLVVFTSPSKEQCYLEKN